MRKKFSLIETFVPKRWKWLAINQIHCLNKFATSSFLYSQCIQRSFRGWDCNENLSTRIFSLRPSIRPKIIHTIVINTSHAQSKLTISYIRLASSLMPVYEVIMHETRAARQESLSQIKHDYFYLEFLIIFCIK